MPITKSSPARTATPSYQQRPSTSLPITTSHGNSFSDAPHTTIKISSSSFFVATLPLPAAFVRPLSTIFLLGLPVVFPMLPALQQPSAPAPAAPTQVSLTHAPSATTSAILQPNSSATMSSSNKASRRANGIAATSFTACSSVQKSPSTGGP